MRKRAFLLTAGLIALSACTASSYQKNGLHEPLPKTSKREHPLNFGLYVTPDPENNPIDPPERFAGFHSATDFEVQSGELEKDIPVYAICSGEIRFSGFSEGYGGLITQYCTIDEQDVTVIYGHLAVDSLVDSGVAVEAGDTIGLLGADNSTDTDGTRKHLHLGIAKGHGGEVRGYVQEESELEGFIDPESILRM